MLAPDFAYAFGPSVDGVVIGNVLAFNFALSNNVWRTFTITHNIKSTIYIIFPFFYGIIDLKDVFIENDRIDTINKW